MSTAAKSIMSNNNYKKAIVFIAKKVYPIGKYKDPFGSNTPNGLHFLITCNNAVERAIENLGRGVHTVQRYCYIISQFIDLIKPTEDIDEERKQLVKKRYLAIAALAKKEYRAGFEKVKKPQKPSFVFQKLSDDQMRLNREYRECLRFKWNKETIEEFKDEFDDIRKNLIKDTNCFRNDDCNNGIAQKLKDQMTEIDKLRKLPGAICAKIKRHTSSKAKITKYDVLFRKFMRRYNPNCSIEALLNDPQNNIIEKLKQDTTTSWGNKDAMLNAVKQYIGCSTLLPSLKGQGVSIKFCFSILHEIEDFAAPMRAKDKIQKKNNQKLQADPYKFFIDKYGLFSKWLKLKKEVHRILDDNLEPRPSLRMLMSLYMDYIPRRSTDYAKMLVIHNKFMSPDAINNLSKDYNYLIFNQQQKLFIFNLWKNVDWKGQQTYKIETNRVIRSIEKHLEDPETNMPAKCDHPDHTDYRFFLAMPSKMPILVCTQICGQLLEIRRRWDIPFAIRDIRHLYATYAIDVLGYGYDRLSRLADQMGNSVKMLQTVYYDRVILSQLNMDDPPEDESDEVDPGEERDREEVLAKSQHYLSLDDEAIEDKESQADYVAAKYLYTKNDELPDLQSFNPQVPPNLKDYISKIKRYKGNRDRPCTDRRGCIHENNQKQQNDVDTQSLGPPDPEEDEILDETDMYAEDIDEEDIDYDEDDQTDETKPKKSRAKKGNPMSAKNTKASSKKQDQPKGKSKKVQFDEDDDDYVTKKAQPKKSKRNTRKK